MYRIDKVKHKISLSLLALMVWVLAGTLTRLLPHPPNFTPIIALSLFSGAYFQNRYLAFLFPLFSLFIGDVFLGFHSLMWAVYGSFLLSVFIGFRLRKKDAWSGIFSLSLLSSLQFFVFTNFAVWMVSGMYPKTFQGLVSCYVSALPFFQNTLMGSLFYAFVLFGSYKFCYTKLIFLRKKQEFSFP